MIDDIFQVDTSEQLRNVSKMKLYKYRYSREYMEHAGLDTSDCEGEDTGVLAQEVKEVLPEAVKESVSKFWAFGLGDDQNYRKLRFGVVIEG